MPFYDIMLLYRTLEEAVKEEQEQQKKQEEEYKASNNIPDYKNFSSNIEQQMKTFNPDSITKGYTMPQMPSLPAMPSI